MTPTSAGQLERKLSNKLNSTPSIRRHFLLLSAAACRLDKFILRVHLSISPPLAWHHHETPSEETILGRCNISRYAIYNASAVTRMMERKAARVSYLVSWTNNTWTEFYTQQIIMKGIASFTLITNSLIR